MTMFKTTTSGMFKKNTLPSLLKCPKLHSFSKISLMLKKHLCYIIRHFGDDGISMLVVRDVKNDNVNVVFGDWAGNSLDLSVSPTNKHVDAALSFADKTMPMFLKTMRLLNIPQAQLFFAFSADGLILTDIQTSINKLSGPGMVRDLFGNIFRTQEVLKVELIDDRAIEYLEKGTGTYEGNLIIKPSRFLTFSDNKSEVPLYAEIRRD